MILLDNILKWFAILPFAYAQVLFNYLEHLELYYYIIYRVILLYTQSSTKKTSTSDI